MSMIKRTLLMFCSALILVGCGGVNNNISFSMVSGSCADGTNNAPYCMAVTIQNNAGGQNYINSTNFPIQNLTFSVSGPNNLNYPLGSGSSMDPNGCVSSNLPPGGTCTFYLQLTGESAPVGPKIPLTINANYTINNTLFGGSNTTASSSFTVYEYPAVVISSTLGSAQRYTNGTSYATFNAESASISVVANNNDNYYGFLYLVGGGNIFASGTESFSYNITKNATNFNNLLTYGTTLYGIMNNGGTGSINSSSIKPIYNVNWATPMNVSTATIPNVRALGAAGLYLTTTSQVYLCYIFNSTQGCVPEAGAVPVGAIQNLAYSVLGSTSSGVPLTGLVIGTSNGLFVESGTTSGLTSNAWMPVIGTSGNITEPINAIVADNNLNLYIAGANNIYELQSGGGNTAKTLFSLASLGNIAITAMVYDNAGKILYVGSSTGVLYACGYYDTANPTTFTCGAVFNSAIGSNLFGLNIITSLLPN